MTSSANSLSSQVATLVENRNAMRIQRDAALQKLEQLQQPPRDLAQIDARLIAVGTEYNRLWELAKAKRLHASRDVDSAPTGSVSKKQSRNKRGKLGVFLSSASDRPPLADLRRLHILARFLQGPENI